MSEIILHSSEISKMDTRYKINLVNTISGLKSANLISTVNNLGVSNLAIFNSVVHIGSNPPLFGMISRPWTVDRHTYENIRENPFYTINQIHKDIYQRAHQSSAKYQRGESEYLKCGLTEHWEEDFPVPFVKESHIKIGLKYVEEKEILANGTILIIGRIEKIILPSESIDPDGFINLSSLQTVCVGGLDSYYEAKFMDRLNYARPDTIISYSST